MNKLAVIFLGLLISFVGVAQDQNIMSGKYSIAELRQILIPRAEWTPFPRLDDRTDRKSTRLNSSH